METLCEQLSTNIKSLIGDRSTHLTRKIMDVLHKDIGNCTPHEYTLLFMRAAALATSTHNKPKTSVEESDILATLTDKMTRTH